MSENYIPLYRKYRPQKLEEIVGQEHIKTALTNAIKLNRIAHAYLFTGPRGTGKTSTARILAKSLNCVKGPTITPCNECISCLNITNSVPIDVIEIDAASNRSVEDAQNILEKIQYVPVNGKYKIYIIDEVHMLSNAAFNALLKTLEEPPENVIFILATTEAHKVLDTIKSRCQRFDFRRITTDDIVKHLKYISKEEKINISNEALVSIAKNSSGGMRDSIALLDQVSILGASKEITEDDINNMLGRLSFESLQKISESIINSDSASAINLIEKVYNSGNDPIQILTNLMYYFKNLLIVKTCDEKNALELTNLNTIQFKSLIKQKELLETHQIVFLIEKTASYIKEIKLTTNQQMWLEVAIIDLSNLTDNTKLIDLQSRIKALEEGKNVQSHKTNMISSVPIKQPKINTELESNVESKSKPIISEVLNKDEFTPMPKSKVTEISNDISDNWNILLSNIANKPTTAILRQMANPVKIEADEIIITFKQEMFVKRIDESKKAAIIEAANKMFNRTDTKITIRTPLDSDTKYVSQKPVIQNKEKEEKKTLIPEVNKVSEEEKETIETIQKNNSENEDEMLKSDQSKMIKKLFDGKYIN